VHLFRIKHLGYDTSQILVAGSLRMAELAEEKDGDIASEEMKEMPSGH